MPRSQALARARYFRGIMCPSPVPETWGTASAGLRLEPSATAALAATDPVLTAASLQPGWPDVMKATHIAWVTGGAGLADGEWSAQLAGTF